MVVVAVAVGVAGYQHISALLCQTTMVVITPLLLLMIIATTCNYGLCTTPLINNIDNYDDDDIDN